MSTHYMSRKQHEEEEGGHLMACLIGTGIAFLIAYFAGWL